MRYCDVTIKVIFLKIIINLFLLYPSLMFFSVLIDQFRASAGPQEVHGRGLR